MGGMGLLLVGLRGEDDGYGRVMGDGLFVSLGVR